MFTFLIIVFVFFGDLFVFSNSEVFVCFGLFFVWYTILFFGINKFYFVIFSQFLSSYKSILVSIFKLLSKFEYFDRSYKFISFFFQITKL